MLQSTTEPAIQICKNCLILQVMDILSKFCVCVTSNTMKTKRIQLVDHQMQLIETVKQEARAEEEMYGAYRTLSVIGKLKKEMYDAPPDYSLEISHTKIQFDDIQCSAPFALTRPTTTYSSAISGACLTTVTHSTMYCKKVTPGPYSYIPEMCLLTDAGEFNFPPLDHYSFKLMPHYSISTLDVTTKYLQDFVEKATSPQRYELLSDNLDWVKKTNRMTKNTQNVSYHWFLVLARETRVLGSTGMSDITPNPNPNEIPNYTFLASESELLQLEQNYIHHISHIITTNIGILKPFQANLPKHISHKHMEAMATKSPFVILDLLDKSENKSDDMIDILKYAQQFVSSYSHWDESDKRFSKSVLRHKVLDGDALTNERAINAQLAMANGRDSFESLQNFISRPGGLHRMFAFVTVTVHICIMCSLLHLIFVNVYVI